MRELKEPNKPSKTRFNTIRNDEAQFEASLYSNPSDVTIGHVVRHFGVTSWEELDNIFLAPYENGHSCCGTWEIDERGVEANYFIGEEVPNPNYEEDYKRYELELAAYNQQQLEKEKKKQQDELDRLNKRKYDIETSLANVKNKLEKLSKTS